MSGVEDVLSVSAVRKLLHRLQLRPSKRLGQSFLVDPDAADSALSAVFASNPSGVIEIGAGLGALTLSLVNLNCPVTAIEVDSRLAAHLREAFRGDDRISIVQADVLKVDLSGLALSMGPGRIVVVGNLPYSVSSPILGRLVETRGAIHLAIVMLQSEVADRISSPPGSRTYGAMSVLLQSVAEIRVLRTVPASSFFPQPEVASSLVALTFHEGVVPKHLRGQFELVVKTAFLNRRKILHNTLAALPGLNGDCSDVLKDAQIDAGLRAEQLSCEDFVSIALAYVRALEVD